MLESDVWFAVIITSLLILLLLAVIVITIAAANRRHAQQEVRYEKELRQMQHEVQEQVLVNVGRELHDNIGQLLTVMNMQIEQHKVINPASVAALQPVSDTLNSTVAEVRRIGKSLNSDLLGANGLVGAIRQETERLQQLNSFSVHLDCGHEPVLDSDQRVIVFRIFQEILNNILKHAGASAVEIKISGENSFKLSVQDNGKGFDLQAMLQSGKGSGLKNMMKRAELGKLICKIDTAIGKGTTFILERSQ